MPGVLSLCLATLIAAGPAAVDRPSMALELRAAELERLLDGQALPDLGDGRADPIHPWRRFLHQAPHSTRTVDGLLELFERTSDPERRERLLEALSLQDDPRLRPLWTGLIDGGQPEDADRWAPYAFEGLLRIGEEQDHRTLLDLLGREPRIDAWLMRALGRTGSRWAADLVLRTYRSEQQHEPLRVAAFEAALALSAEAPELLREGLAHRSRAIRLAALGHVAVCSDPPPVDRLVELADDLDTALSAAARRRLAHGCASEAFRRATVRHLLSHPRALASAPDLLLALAEWADESGALFDAEALYRRALSSLPPRSTEQLRALFRLGDLLALTGRPQEAAQIGERLRALASDAPDLLLTHAPGSAAPSRPLEEATSTLIEPPLPVVTATLAPIPLWHAWRLTLVTTSGRAGRITVHRVRFCSTTACADPLGIDPASRVLDQGEPLRVYLQARPFHATPRCRDTWAVIDASTDDWRGRLLVRCRD